MTRLLLLLIFSAGLFSCAPSRFVKPLKEKEKAVNLSLGGPLIGYSEMTIPVPLLSATYGYGFDSSLTGFAGLNITSALYGNVQIEAGVTRQLSRQKGWQPAVSISPVANFIYRNADDHKFYPQLDLNAFWEFNRHRNFVYTGFSNWFELAGKKAHDQEQTIRWLFSPVVGHTFLRDKWEFSIEAKVLAPHIYYQSNVVDYKSPFGRNGAFGIYFGYTKKF